MRRRPDAFVFGAETGKHQPNIQTAWEVLKLLAYDFQPKPGREGEAWNREQLRRIDLRWHDLRHGGACRLLADGVDNRIVQLMPDPVIPALPWSVSVLKPRPVTFRSLTEARCGNMLTDIDECKQKGATAKRSRRPSSRSC